MRLIDIDALKKEIEKEHHALALHMIDKRDSSITPICSSISLYTLYKIIDSAPTVFECRTCKHNGNERECADCYGDHSNYAPTVEGSQGECKTCKYYHPYYEQFTNIPRGDGYCVIARMTPEGMTTINCNDEFYCSDYQKGGAE